MAEVLIPSVQGTISNKRASLVITPLLSLNPFGTGNNFKLDDLTVSLKLISLNPFGTGNNFKQNQKVNQMKSITS